MDDLGTITTRAGYYFNESKKISSPFDTKYYDEIITKPHIQAREEYERTMQNPQNQKTQEEEQEGLHNQIRRKRILLVDDEPDICMTFQMVLQDAGYECIPYTDSIKALKEFRANYYDLILLDIKMPKLDGFALYENIRELDKTLRVIFITAGEEYYEKFRERYYPDLIGIYINYIQKPVGSQELIQIVNMTIATRDKN
jgi:CheY-like chemotaxis protein